MRVFRSTYTRKPPAGAEPVARRGVPHVRWKARGGRWIEGEVLGNGKVRVVVTDVWYYTIRDHAAAERTRKGVADKAATEAMARRDQVEADQIRAGVRSPTAAVAAGRTMAAHLADYVAELADRGNSPEYLRHTRSRLLALITGTAPARPDDLTSDRVLGWVGTRRRAGDFGAVTANHYLRAARGFVRWMVRTGRADRNPLDGMAALEDGGDKRRRRRSLSEDEFTRLLKQGRASRHWRVRRNAAPWGLEREMLYLVAGYSGLRAHELATLTPDSFRLDADPPHVVVSAAYSKAKREDRVPLQPAVVERIRAWLAGKPAGRRLWPGTWYRRAARFLERDLDAARAAWLAEAETPAERARREGSDVLRYRDRDGRYADFHSLRRTFVSRLIRAGANPKTVQELARHKTIALTMDVYAATDGMAERAAAAALLPPPAA